MSTGPALQEKSPELVLPEPAPDRLTTIEALDEHLLEKGVPRPCRKKRLYPRDGHAEIADIEELLSEVTIPEQHLNVVVPAGMSAIGVATGTALSLSHKMENGRRKDPTLAYANGLYGQSSALFQDYKDWGISAYGFNSGSEEDLDRIMEEKPDVVFLETVANTPDMPVANIRRLLDWGHSDEGSETTFVFDNTLPLKTGIDFDTLLTPEDKVLIVESFTKAELHNSDMGGVVYSKNEELIREVRRQRITHGLSIPLAATRPFIEALETALPGFHERNKALFASTGKIALALWEARKELGKDADFDISFPTLPNHPNYAYVKDNMPKRYVPKKVSPVVFIGSNDMYEGAGRDLLDRITRHPRMEEQIKEGQSYFGQSFGYPEATYLYHPDYFYVRFSGGYDMDSDAFAAAIKEAAADK
jgi:cystathionine beta-lyase/cystathionine gamma-synthase